MSLKLPPETHSVRTLIDFDYIASLGTMAGRSRLVSFPLARAGARTAMADDPAIKSVNAVCLRHDGELWLVEFKRLTFKKLWSFGNLSSM